MTVLNIIVILVILAVAWYVWQNLVVPNLRPPLGFLVWLVPLVVGVFLILWLLSLVFGGSILNVKVF